MKEMLTLENFPMVIIVALVALAYLSFFSVILGG